MRPMARNKRGGRKPEPPPLSRGVWLHREGALAKTERGELLASLAPHELEALGSWYWQAWARDEQLPPDQAWRTWLIRAGRGFGKTRAGAEWVRDVARHDGGARIALVGMNLAEVRSVMVEGDSGILAAAPGALAPVFEPSLRRLTWDNGAIAWLYSAGEPDSLRGPQHSHARRAISEGGFRQRSPGPAGCAGAARCAGRSRGPARSSGFRRLLHRRRAGIGRLGGPRRHARDMGADALAVRPTARGRARARSGERRADGIHRRCRLDACPVAAPSERWCRPRSGGPRGARRDCGKFARLANFFSLRWEPTEPCARVGVGVSKPTRSGFK